MESDIQLRGDTVEITGKLELLGMPVQRFVRNPITGKEEKVSVTPRIDVLEYIEKLEQRITALEAKIH